MTDYTLYREQQGISRSEMREAMRDKYPMFSKVVMAMIEAPEKFGVCLTPEAEQHLISTFGPACN